MAFGKRFSELQPGWIDLQDFGNTHDLAWSQAFAVFDFLDHRLIGSRLLGQLILGESFLPAGGTESDPNVFGTGNG